MSGWVRFENATPEAIDRKTLLRDLPTLSDRAFRLWFNAVCFCSRAETDGRVPVDQLLRLSGSATKRAADELLAAGLLEQEGERSYVVHDYLDHNPSRDRLQKLREEGRKRVAKHRGNGVTEDVSNGSSNEHETPLPPARERVRSVDLSSLKPTHNSNDKGEDDSAGELPTGFPDELVPHLDAVEPVLADLAERHGAGAVRRLSLASVIAGRPKKPFVRAARDFAAWADGQAQKRRDVVAGYRNWLDKTNDLAATERLEAEPSAARDNDFSIYDRAAGI